MLSAVALSILTFICRRSQSTRSSSSSGLINNSSAKPIWWALSSRHTVLVFCEC